MTNKLNTKIILILVLILATTSILVGCSAKTLDTPNIAEYYAGSNMINWDAINDAEYKIEYDNVVVVQSEPSFKLRRRGNYTIYVTAIPKDGDKKHKPSKRASIEVNYSTIIAKPDVELTKYVGGDVKYVIKNFDSDANHYVINVADKDYVVNTARGVIDTNLSDGKYAVKVKGIGDDIITRNSQETVLDVNIAAVNVSTDTYETQDTLNNYVKKFDVDAMKIKDAHLHRVDMDFSEVDAKEYSYNSTSGEFVFKERLILDHAINKVLTFDLYFENGEIIVIKLNIVDNRKVNIGSGEYISVYKGNPAMLQFDVYTDNVLVGVDVVQAENKKMPLIKDTDYVVSYNMGKANLLIKKPNPDTDKSLVLNFKKGKESYSLEVKYYFHDKLPYLSTTHTTYNKAYDGRSDVIIRYNPEFSVTDVVLDYAKKDVDYLVEPKTGIITLKKSYLDKLDGGAIVIGRVYFGSEYETFALHIIDDGNVSLVFAEENEYSYTVKANDQLAESTDKFVIKLSGEASSVYAVSVDSLKIDKTMYKVFVNSGKNDNGTKIRWTEVEISTALLNSLGAGVHEIRLHISDSTRYDVVVNVVVDNVALVANNVVAKIDNSYPNIKVSFDAPGKEVVTFVTNNRTNKKYYNKDGESFVLVPYSDMNDNDTYTVTHMRGAEAVTSKEYTYNRVDIKEFERYYDAKFTYGGKTYDAVIESEEEFEAFVHYAHMRVSKMRAYDDNGITTDSKDTMMWRVASVPDTSEKYEYTVKVYTPYLAYASEDGYKTLIKQRFNSAAKSYKEPTMTRYYVQPINDRQELELSLRVMSTNNPYEPNKKGHEVKQTKYKLDYESVYATSKPRSVTFNDFAIDKWTKTQSVYLADELYYAIEDGARPIPVKGSPAEEMYEIIKDVLREICDDSMSEHQKYMAIYEWVVSEVTYDQATAEYANSIKGASDEIYSQIYARRAFYLEGVFVDKIAVCNGLAKAITVMAGIEGINSMKVVGEANGRHAWNKVRLDGIWYNSDPTWGGGGSKEWDGYPRKGELVAEGLSHENTLVADNLFTYSRIHLAEDRFRNKVVGNITFNYFANRVIDVTDTDIHTMIFSNEDDIKKYIDKYKDELKNRTEYGISFLYSAPLNESTISNVAVEAIRKATGDNRWTATGIRIVKSSYNRNYKFIKFDKANN